MKWIDHKKFLYKHHIRAINISSQKSYQAVALFVDKSKYICWMVGQRKRLKMREPYRDVEMPAWQLKGSDGKFDSRMKRLINQADHISKELKAPILMQSYIFQTVFHGKIWREQKLLDYIGSQYRYHEQVRRVIVPDFTTTDKEVIDAFQEIKQEYIKVGRYLGVNKHKRYKRDYFNKYRKWYWERMDGMSAREMAIKHNKTSQENWAVSPSEIELGLKYYRRWLKE